MDLAIKYPRSRLGGMDIFHMNTLKKAGPPVGHRQNLFTDKICPGQHFVLAKSVCLCVAKYIGYKMKTCTRIPGLCNSEHLRILNHHAPVVTPSSDYFPCCTMIQ